MNKKSVKSGDTSVRHIEIETRLKDDEGNILFDMDTLKEVLEEKQHIIKEYCYIIHDKDVYEEDSEKYKKGDLKPAHVHLLIQFADNQPQKRKYIAKWFGLAENFLQNVKSWKGACLYLIHFNAKDKHPYDVSEVTANFDYSALVEKAEKEKAEKDVSVRDIIISKIMSGEIREYNKTLQIDGRTLVKYSREIETAFKYYAERLQATQKDRKTEIIYIEGDSGVGKTTLAKKIAESKGLDYFISSGSNDIMDGYGGQPCLLIDDVRPSCMGLSDLLKMLDPNTASSVKSRYKNKYLNAELVILTTILSIDTFYKNAFAENEEPILQLKRRCSTYIKMTTHEICVSVWDKGRLHYSNPVIYENNILKDYIPKEAVTEEYVSRHVAGLIPFLEKKEIPAGDVLPLEKVSQKKPQKKASLTTDCISDEAFCDLMPK